MRQKQFILSWRMLTLSIILPLNLLILVFVMFMQLWFFQAEKDREGLVVKRYLWKPLYTLLTAGEDEEPEVPQWLYLVVMDDGSVVYPNAEVIARFIHIAIQSGEDPIGSFLASITRTVSYDMNLVQFNYKGKTGICYYIDEQFSGHYRLLGKRSYLINLFLLTTLLFHLGFYIMIYLRRNILDLIKAADRLRRRDFTTPVIPRRRNELNDLYRAFEELRKELNRNTNQGMLMLLSVTHDLKTPLTSIKGYLEAFRDGVVTDTDDALEIIDTMLDKTSLLDSRISEILDIVKDIGLSTQQDRTFFSLKDWLEELDEYFVEEIKLHNKHYDLNLNIPETQELKGNRKILNRAVINLFDNALRYSGENATIRFSAEVQKKQDRLSITMEDSGEGIDEKEWESIFQMFYRLDKGRNTRGMGIGLASVKFIVEEHGGTVRCGRSDLGGALFEIQLPLEN